MIKDPKTDLFIKFVYTVVSAIWLLIMPLAYYTCYKIDADIFMGALMGSVAMSIALFGISWSMIKKFYKLEKDDRTTKSA